MSMVPSVDRCNSGRYRGSMETFGERLHRLRELRKISQAELARRVGWTSGYVSLIEANKRLVDALPRHDFMVRLSEVLGVPIEELTGEIAPKRIERPRFLTEQELFERFGIRPYEEPMSVEGVVASAGSGAAVPQDIDDTRPRRRRRGSHLWEVPVTGDCMVTDLFPGEIVIYNERLEPEVGSIMVALRDEDDLIIKRLVVEDGRQLLRPNKGNAIEVDERVRFLGRAVSAQRRLF